MTMKPTAWRRRLLESTRGQLLELLRTKSHTVNELAAALHLTDNAVRAQLLSLERDGLIHQAGTQSGFRKPHAVYALTAEAEQVFPKAYGALVTRLLSLLSRAVDRRTLRAGMREIGRTVAEEHLPELQGKSRAQRVAAALRILKDLGGSATFDESEGRHFIRGHGCPLAAATSEHPEACLIAESLLTEVIGTPVKEHCVRGPVPSCRFEIK